MIHSSGDSSLQPPSLPAEILDVMEQKQGMSCVFHLNFRPTESLSRKDVFIALIQYVLGNLLHSHSNWDMGLLPPYPLGLNSDVRGDLLQNPFCFLFFEMEFHSCHPGWSTVVRAQLTATSTSMIKQFPASDSRVAGTTGMHHHTRLLCLS